MAISLLEARGTLSQTVIDVYREGAVPAPAFFRSFFPSVETGSRLIGIEVERGDEKIAVDVLRGTEGNRNTFSRSTLKVIEPPFYNEYFDVTELAVYDIWMGVAGAGVMPASIMMSMAEETNARVAQLQAKIERSYERQAAQVLQTGIVTVADGSNIDFKRKAASLVDGSATAWSDITVDPYAQIADGIDFVRRAGRATGNVYNVILGSAAQAAFFNNPFVLKRGPLSNINFDALLAPQRNSTGANRLVAITARDYQVNIWSYSDTYEDAAGNQVPYLDPKNMIILPENPRFHMGFGLVPQLIESGTVDKSAFVVQDYIDLRKKSHIYDVSSAGIAIPVAVDQIYTRKVIA